MTFSDIEKFLRSRGYRLTLAYTRESYLAVVGEQGFAVGSTEDPSLEKAVEGALEKARKRSS